MAAAVDDPDPVLYYEHIGLYRDPRVKQLIGDDAPAPLPIGKAALRRAGSDLAIVSYGAYVHVAMRVAEALAKDGVESAVLDLRTIAPLDRDAILDVARHCSRVLVVHEDTRTGSFGDAEIDEIAHGIAGADVVAFSSMTGYGDLTKTLATRVRELNPHAYTMW